jgi:6-phosphogluconolactonase
VPLNIREHRLPNADALAQSLAADIEQRLLLVLRRQTTATLFVSGGKSPIALFKALSARALPWHAITVSLADERCAHNTDEASNALLVRTHLLQDYASSATFVPVVDIGPHTPMPSPLTLADTASQQLANMAGIDVLVLGMGADGHTASLFPQAPQLRVGLDLQQSARYIATSPQTAAFERVSLNVTAILSARHIAVAIGGGADKHAVFEQVKSAKTDALPLSHVLHNHAGTSSIDIWLND